MFLRFACFSLAFLSLFSSFSFADENKNIFADYTSDIRKPADAKANNVYNAWGDNMANLIESGYRDGVVVTGEGDYAKGKVRADGAGNIVVDKYANVGPIINKPNFSNTNIVIRKDPNKNLNITKKNVVK